MKRPALALAGALALLAGAVPVSLAADRVCTSPPRTCILEAIATLDPASDAHFTQSGKPRVAAIETVAGIDITGAERDAAWAEFDAWQARRAASEAMRAALAEVTAERDRIAEHAGRLEAQIAGFRVDAERAERAAAEAHSASRAAERRAAAAEDKARALAGGGPVCAAERAVVAADESWRASKLRAKARALLDCLAIGER